MANINLKLPDGKIIQIKKGQSCIDAAKQIGEGLAKAALAAKVDDKLVDMDYCPNKDANFQIITFKDEEGKNVFWHSTTHVMAAAVLKCYPKAKLTIGPPVKDGFYYDIDMESVHPDDFPKIENAMKEIIEGNHACTHDVISIDDAKKRFKDNEYKLEILKEIEEKGDETVTLYHIGDQFTDLCRGPHIPNIGMIKAFKVMKAAGAYWRADAKNKQLQRLYGTSFPDKKELKQYLYMLEEAEKRDHRKIGKELGLFSFHEEGAGFPFFHHKGMVIWDELIAFWKKVHKPFKYKLVKTPIMLDRTLWETSKHWFNYKENMYTLQVDNQDFAVKPMNCPGGILMYKENVHSYREFPLKLGEIGPVHRHELSGTLSGLFRVRAFHQDDTHIFMTPDQVKDQILEVITIGDTMYKQFGFEYHLELSTRPEKSTGTDEQWKLCTSALKDALDELGKPYKINEGDGAFYGPKIDLHLKDAIGRTWQCGTIQVDMAQPDNFDLLYEAADGKRHRPVMIHRTIYGSLERFFGLLVEHYAGKFPLWINPNQVKIITVVDKVNEFAKEVEKKIFEHNIRVEIDNRSETMNKKVREAQLQQFNFIVTIGEKEAENKTLAIRSREGKVTFGVKVDDFVSKVKSAIENKKEVEF